MSGGVCPPHIGGVETVIENVSMSLASLGHDVTIICCHEGAKKVTQQYASNRVLYIGWPVRVYKVPKSKNKLRKYLTCLLYTSPSPRDRG